jgi:filamentous hemagglutinin family protein
VAKHQLQGQAIATFGSIISLIFLAQAAFTQTIFTQASSAQNAIAPDSTLPTNTLIDFNPISKTYTITGGTQVGANQFHSFRDFGIPTNNTVHFDNALTTTNIIGRVTGSNISNIDGIVKANGNANLYVINPNGIIFGPNAKLEIGGSFGATTANSLKFGDGSEFSATNPQAPPLLSVNVPLGLQYGNSKVGATISDRANLSTGQDLVLNADRLNLQGTLQAGRDLILQASLINGAPMLFAGGDVALGNYAGSSLHILAGGDVILRNVTINGKGNVNNTINPLNTSKFNDSKTYADLSKVSLTDYRPILNSNGTVKEIIPVRIPIAINGSNRATLDVRSGIDWAQLGGFPIGSPSLVETTKANIRVNGNIRVSEPSGLVLLTNHFASKALLDSQLGVKLGAIATQSIDTSTDIAGANAGDIRVHGKGDITLNGEFGAYAEPASGNAGNGGVISISSYSGDIKMDTTLYSSSFTRSGNAGNGGAISFSSYSGNINTNRLYFESSSFSNRGNSANAGAISLTSHSGDIIVASPLWKSPSASITSGDSGNGGSASFATYSGDILISDARGFRGDVGIYLDAGTYSGSGSSGNGGKFSLASHSGNISLINAPLNSSTASYSKSNTHYSGNGGAISLATSLGNINLDDVTLYSYSFANSANSRDGGAISLFAGAGNILLNTSTLSAYSLATIGSSQNGGDISISAPNGNITSTLASYLLSFSISSANAQSGNGGEVTLTAKNQIRNLGLFTASAFGQAGSVNINGLGDLTIADLQIITSKTVNFPKRDYDANDPNTFISIIFDKGLNGRSGDVKITGLGNLILENNIINSTTQSRNPAGNIAITSAGLVIMRSNTEILSSTTNVGNAGNIRFEVGDLILTDGALVSASTSGAGKAGDILLKANNLTIANGAKVQTTTSNQGDSGKIEAIVGNNFIITGSDTGLFANTTKDSTGKGGSIFVDPPLVSITNGAGISVNSLGAGNGGDLQIIADKFVFENNAFLFANTASGEGGNINLHITDIFFPRNNSTITATAGGNGNGGNISLRSLFTISIPSENNDIFANAFLGKGGNINITTQGLFGIEFRSSQTNLSDITASSEFGLQGNVSINTLGFDPSKGLISLPVDVRDPSRLVKESCAADRYGNEFIITGKGGLPAKPSDRPIYTSVLDNFGTFPNHSQLGNLNAPILEPIAKSDAIGEDAIVEATGWIIDAQNQVVLVAGGVPRQDKIRCRDMSRG